MEQIIIILLPLIGIASLVWVAIDGNKRGVNLLWLWILLTVFFWPFGLILYFTIGRSSSGSGTSQFRKKEPTLRSEHASKLPSPPGTSGVRVKHVGGAKVNGEDCSESNKLSCEISVNDVDPRPDGTINLHVKSCQGPLPPQSFPIRGITYDIDIIHVETGICGKVITWVSLNDFLSLARQFGSTIVGSPNEESSTPPGMAVSCKFSNNEAIAKRIPAGKFKLEWRR